MQTRKSLDMEQLSLNSNKFYYINYLNTFSTMKNLTKLSIVGIFIFLLSWTASAQGNTPYDNDIRTLLTVNKTKESMEQTIPMMIEQFKQMRPDIPEKIWSGLQKEMKGEGLNDLIERMIPMYKKHFTHAEVKELVTFYKSPIGTKLAKKTPIMTQESYGIGQEWGKQLGQKMAVKLKKQGY